MNHYRVTFTNSLTAVVQAAGFSAHGTPLTFYRYDGMHDPGNGVYANPINTHMFKMEDVSKVELVDEPVAI